MNKSLLVIGSINADLYVEVPRLPAPGETIAGDDAAMRPGGKGANQAVASARLGAETWFAGKLGSDAYAPPLRLALEGALKLKEISYIHAEGYPAAEMKHGPIAMIDEKTPSAFLIPQDQLYDKTISNLQEIKARKGPIIAIATEGDENIARQVEDVIYIPSAIEPAFPLLAVVPLQLLAYHIAVIRGCDVDKPRNLAKSVTVE